MVWVRWRGWGRDTRWDLGGLCLVRVVDCERDTYGGFGYACYFDDTGA